MSEKDAYFESEELEKTNEDIPTFTVQEPTKWNGYKTCHSCKARHACCPHDPPLWEDCPHWKLGKCYTCKHVDADDDEWYERGCETWCFGGCKKYSRDWVRTFEYIRRFITDRRTNNDRLY